MQKNRNQNLTPESDDWSPGGIEEDAAIVEAQELPLNLENKITEVVRHHKISVAHIHDLPHDGKVNVVGLTVLSPDHRRRHRC